METTMYLAIARQAALRREMDSVALNIANASTTGYKSQAPMFREVLARAGQSEKISMVIDQGLMTNTTDGSLKMTENNFDLSIRGPGYFTIQTPAGERYTRNGNFKLDAESRLVTQADNGVVGADGRPIVIPPGTADVRISADGTIVSGAQVLGQVKISGFANDHALRRGTHGLMIADEAPQAAPQAKVVQGAVEESNVVPMFEITRMQEIARNYTQANNMIDKEHERQRDAVRRIGRAAGSV